MKRRFAYDKDDKRIIFDQKKYENELFSGIICYVKYTNVENPLIVNNGISDICIFDNGYEWLELYPTDGNYALTIMFDNKKNIIEWYFDVSKRIGVENGIPFEDDLYLDYVITPDKKELVLDEDELLYAVESGDITDNDKLLAYNIVEKLKEKYFNNFENLLKLTTESYNLFNENIKKL